ncbi:DNA topoisomerase 4 subunit A [Clostridia bacterium OttesenSCG-928-F22]|nr:DNA topoisomerase 4 subunit A [Clostridia bacterium OttesenSCG-928-F22]
MSKKNPPEIAQDRNILSTTMEEAMHNSMMPYAEYVIMERALPRVEDGLKPVQRRILYTLMELGITPDKPHKKSARIVGDALGKYHPHGDTSVYDAMVRMAQNFNMREPLIDGHGNFGSIDGDSAAAMRYTEARSTHLALELLRDIEKDTVPFKLNFDDSLTEPEMLPGRFPNLLVNGASGIAVAIATNIPPHNLGEVIDGTVAMIDKPAISLDEMMQYIKAPDFPTGGYLLGNSELTQAYQTGKGKLVIRAKTHIEPGRNGRQQIVITELPYQVNKAACLERILKLSEDKKNLFAGIADIRDESDRTGIRAVVEVKKDADVNKILQYLFKYSDLQITFGVNMVAIADGKPQLLGLLDILRYYINYQKQVITRRTQYDLENATKREHILSGLMIAVDNIDKVIALIRGSKTPAEARDKLMAEFTMTQVQAQAVLDLRLQRLTNLEILTLQEEYDKIVKLIAELKGILGNERKLMNVIKKELLEIKKKYENPRRTQLTQEIPKEILVEKEPVVAEDVVLVFKQGGYINRIPQKAFHKNVAEAAEDTGKIERLVEMNTATNMHLFTNLGNMFKLDANSIPESKLKDRGVLLNSILAGFEKGEKVIAVLPEMNGEESLLFFTQQGMIKRTAASEYNVRKSKIAACGLKDGDELLAVEQQQADTTILLLTSQGYSINMQQDIPQNGRTAAGVKGMKLGLNDKVVAAFQVAAEGEIAVITDRGYGKRSFVFDYEVQGRNGKGLKTFDFKKNGSNGYEIIAAFYIKMPCQIRCIQKEGDETLIHSEEIPIESRFSKGQPLVMVLLDNTISSAKRSVL